MSAQVLVTDAGSHLGLALVENLVARGYRVRAGVCSPNDARKCEPLRLIGAKVVHLDITRPDMLAPVMESCDGVFQTVSVPEGRSKHTDRDIVTPAVEGALNVLAAARNAGIERIVFTSSVAAVGKRSDGGSAPRLSEEEWNEHPVNPCVRAKTEAERRAWEFTRANGMKMVAINPAVLLGPGFHRHTPSTETFERILREQLPVLPPFSAAYVDVRDVADLHRLAFESDDANGRYIAANSPTASMQHVAEIIREIEPAIRIPRISLPEWMARSLAVLDCVTSRIRGRRRQRAEDIVDEFGGAELDCSSDKAARDLGWIPRPLETTLADTLSWIRARFLCADRP
jgi:nucleoside-diphosphate-sugar epimerase